MVRPDRKRGSFSARRYRFGPSHALAPHCHARPSVVLVTAGAFTGSVNGRSYACDVGEIAVLPAETRHSERMGPAGVRTIILTPVGEASNARLNDAVSSLRVLRGPLVRRLVWRLTVEWHRRDASTDLALDHLEEELVDQVSGNGDRADHTPVPSGIHRAKALLEALPAHTLTLDEVAREAGLSRAHLTRTFRRATGCSVGAYQRRVRLDQAAQLLRDTNRGIADIAYSMGFFDQSHFSSAFRHWVGCPPGIFRRIVHGSPRAETDDSPVSF